MTRSAASAAFLHSPTVFLSWLCTAVVLTAAELWGDILVRDYTDYYFTTGQKNCAFANRGGLVIPKTDQFRYATHVSCLYKSVIYVEMEILYVRYNSSTRRRVQHTAACAVVLVAFEVSSRIRRVS